jgi:hypothetical protein
MNTKQLTELLARAERSQGWNFRSELPCAVRIAGGCVLHVVPAWLWQPRIRPYAKRFRTQPVPLRRAG